jgi:uncharacterized surface protein with fasciclin (FAS1) repeats
MSYLPSPKKSPTARGGAHQRSSLAAPKNPPQSIVDIASSNPDFSILVDLLKKTNLIGTLKKQKNITVFAPTDKAFKKLDKNLLKKLLSPEGENDLKDILLYHVLGNKITSDMIKGASTPETLQGKNLCVFLKNGKVKVNDGQVIKADIVASNGIIHVVDTVLTPLNNCDKYS